MNHYKLDKFEQDTWLNQGNQHKLTTGDKILMVVGAALFFAGLGLLMMGYVG